MRLILGSNSKYRQEIFDKTGLKYEVITSLVEEKSDKKNPLEYVKDLSKNKANSVSNQVKGKAIIITCDEIITLNNKIFEKPKSKEEAFNNIKELIGKINYAITGITIKDLYQNKEITFTDTCEIKFKDNISDEDIRWYIDNEENLLNSCGYTGEKGMFFIDYMKGDYFTFAGISPSKIYDKLQELGYKLSDFELK